MRIVSDGFFDPRCPSQLVVANAHTMQPRPNPLRPITVEGATSEGMRCLPCIEPVGDNDTCCRNCFQLELPDITIDPQTNCGIESGGLGYLDTSGGVFILSGCAGEETPCGPSPLWDFGCGWLYAENREKVPGNPNPSSDMLITLKTVSSTEAFLNILFTPFGDGGYIQKGYFCHNFTCSGGTFVNEPSMYDGPAEDADCENTDAEWPDSIYVAGVPCP